MAGQVEGKQFIGAKTLKGIQGQRGETLALKADGSEPHIGGLVGPGLHRTRLTKQAQLVSTAAAK